MTMKISTGIAYQDTDIAAGTTFIAVPWHILDDDDTLLMDATQAFPLGTSDDDIKAFLSKTLSDYESKKAGEDASKANQAALDAAASTAEAVSNLTITT